MTTLLLAVIYIAFISLGLPDSLLGSAWPLMYGQLGVPVSYAGILSMIIAGGTIISSLFSDKLIRKLSTAKVTIVSVAVTAIALMGFSISGSFWMLCLWAIPYGLGAGSVDVALNNYVALNYASRHMSWLHCFWGIGATAGPYIMGLCLTNGFGWNAGYRTISFIQIVLAVILVFSLPLWNRKKKSHSTDKNVKEPVQNALSLKQTVCLPGAKAILTAFLCYCAIETTTGLWASTFLVLNKGMDARSAAEMAALFYLGITVGRLLCGFVTNKVGDKNMVRAGQCFAGIGILLLFLSRDASLALAGLLFIGFGCAPIYPSLLHQTPENFGVAHSQSIMGMQMASAYVGSTFMPPVFGFIADKLDIRIFPIFLVIFIIIMFVMVERMNKVRKNHINV